MAVKEAQIAVMAQQGPGAAHNEPPVAVPPVTVKVRGYCCFDFARYNP